MHAMKIPTVSNKQINFDQRSSPPVRQVAAYGKGNLPLPKLLHSNLKFSIQSDKSNATRNGVIKQIIVNYIVPNSQVTF